MDSILYTRIKELCLEAGTTFAKLEADLGFSRTTISKWKGAVTPSIDKVTKIANYFHVSIDYLAGASDIRSTANDLAGDPDYISLQRARERMSEQDKERMMGILRIGFDYAFSDQKKDDE